MQTVSKVGDISTLCGIYFFKIYSLGDYSDMRISINVYFLYDRFLCNTKEGLELDE